MEVTGDLVELAESLAAETQAVRWCPESPTSNQKAFLELDDEEALYGGSAGGGKSSALLAGVLEGAEIPGYSGIILRKQYADLVMTGGLLDRAHLWLGPTAAEWSAGLMQYRFPSGARVSFGHLNAESLTKLQGAEFHHIAIDEAGQLEPKHILYAGSRLRRHRSFPYKPRMRLASNPGGPAHQFLFDRYVAEGSRFPFIPARLTDNPHIDQAEYTARLMELDSVTRAQLLEGQWILNRAAMVFSGFDRGRNVVRTTPPIADMEFVFGVDLGSSDTKPTTGLVVLGFTPYEPITYVLHARKHAGMTPSSLADELTALTEAFGPPITIVMDYGALGRAIGEEVRMRWGHPIEPAEKTGKLGFIRLVDGAFGGDEERGLPHRLEMLEEATGELAEELESLRWDDERGLSWEKTKAKGGDDLIMALVYAYRRSYAWTQRADRPKPAPVTQRDLDERRAEDLLAAEMKAHRTKESTPWWMRI